MQYKMYVVRNKEIWKCVQISLIFFLYTFSDLNPQKKNLKCLEKLNKRETLAYLPCTDIKVLIIWLSSRMSLFSIFVTLYMCISSAIFDDFCSYLSYLLWINISPFKSLQLKILMLILEFALICVLDAVVDKINFLKFQIVLRLETSAFIF